MLETQSVFMNLLFTVWIRCGQAIGLILVEFDKDNDRFYQWKFSSIYCALFGTLMSIAHVIILVQFSMSLAASMQLFSFTVFVSSISAFLFFVVMVFSYQQQYVNRDKLCQSLNSFVYFYRNSKKSYQEFENQNYTKSLQKSFFVSTSFKLGLFVSNIFIFHILREDTSFDYQKIILAFPALVTAAVCNQYFLGILIIKFFLTTINRKLTAVIMNIYSMLPNDPIENDLEKIAHVHTQIFEFLKELQGFYGSQLAWNIFNNFVAVAIGGFQIFSILLTVMLNRIVSMKSDKLVGLVTFNFFMIFFDIFYHLRICASCSDEVSVSRFQRVRNIFVSPFQGERIIQNLELLRSASFFNLKAQNSVKKFKKN